MTPHQHVSILQEAIDVIAMKVLLKMLLMSVQEIATVLISMNAQQITTASTTVVPILIALTHHQVTHVAARVVTPVSQPTSTMVARILMNAVTEAMTAMKRPLAPT